MTEQSEAGNIREREMSVSFIEKQLQGNEPARCVDGRPAPDSPQGPQMLGGSLQPIVIEAIYSGKPITQEIIAAGIQKLTENGQQPGVHHGAHKKGEVSDCGLADKLKLILATVKEKKGEISSRLGSMYDQEGLPKEDIEKAYEKFDAYNPEVVNLTGEALVKCAIENGCADETVEGDHTEEVAFFNLKEGTTLDTKALNEKDQQAFNQDAWMAVKQSEMLGVDPKIATALSGILFIATEMVLVEAKGKPALPIIVNK